MDKAALIALDVSQRLVVATMELFYS